MKTKPDDLITVELTRVLASDCFSRATQLRRLLAYLVESARAGRVLTEQDVAIEALGRRTGFDPLADAIVRKEMGRLRRRLATFYEQEGRGQRRRIQIPKGSYTATLSAASPLVVLPLQSAHIHLLFQPLRALGTICPSFVEVLSDDLLTGLVRRPHIVVATGPGKEQPDFQLWGNVTQTRPDALSVRLRLSHTHSGCIFWQTEQTFSGAITPDEREGLVGQVDLAAQRNGSAILPVSDGCPPVAV